MNLTSGNYVLQFFKIKIVLFTLFLFKTIYLKLILMWYGIRGHQHLVPIYFSHSSFL